MIAAIPAGPIAEKILRHLGLPTEAPTPGRARLAAQTTLWDTGPSVDEISRVPDPDDFDQSLAEHESPA